MNVDRVQSYDLEHNPTKAWNTLSDMIKHLQIDLYIIRVNEQKVGTIPQDIQQELRSLQKDIEKVLKNA